MDTHKVRSKSNLRIEQDIDDNALIGLPIGPKEIIKRLGSLSYLSYPLVSESSNTLSLGSKPVSWLISTPSAARPNIRGYSFNMPRINQTEALYRLISSIAEHDRDLNKYIISSLGERCLRLTKQGGLEVFSAVELNKPSCSVNLKVPTILPDFIPNIAESLNKLCLLAGKEPNNFYKVAENPENRFLVAQKLALSALYFVVSNNLTNKKG